MVLLVVMADGHDLDAQLLTRIRTTLGRDASPLHVPSVVVAVPDLPRTHNGKDSERAARDAVEGPRRQRDGPAQPRGPAGDPDRGGECRTRA